MRREIFLHFSFWFSFFILITLANQLFSLNYWPFWLGGIIGTILPDIDHILYLYLKPQELTTQRVESLVDKHEVKRVFTLMYETRSERKDLIFHTVFFQVIFLILTFWVLASSGSLFGKGLVLAFSLHLVIDQILDLSEVKSFDNWLKYSPFHLPLDKAKIYWLSVVLLVIFFGIML